MSLADAVPRVLHGCIEVGWVPQVVDENASLRLQAVALTEQRDEATRQLAATTELANALWDRVQALERAVPATAARVAPPPSTLLVAWAALCNAWATFWECFETDASRGGRPA